MAIERERKFLVDHTKLPKFVKLALEVDDQTICRKMKTGYFTKDGVAIRASVGNVGRHNPKSKVCFSKVCFKGFGLELREKFEYNIPLEDALRLVELAPFKVEKTRIEYQGWEIDFFNLGGVMAEWEYHEGKDDPVLPEWILSEVTDDVRYANQKIAVNGFPA